MKTSIAPNQRLYRTLRRGAPLSRDARPLKIQLNIFLTAFVLSFALIPGTGIGANYNYLTGTSIVAIRTGTEVVVGADSLAVLTGEDASPIYVCKILQVGRAFFATARLVADNQGEFDVARTVRATYRENEPLLASVRRFETEMVPQLREVVAYIRDHDRRYFEKEVANKPALEIAFFGWEDSAPVLYLRYFTVRAAPDSSFTISARQKNCPGDCPGGVVYTALGHHDAIDEKLKRVPHYWRRGTVTSVRELIELEARAKPQFVGGAIDIIHLTASGPKWPQHKPQCPPLTP